MRYFTLLFFRFCSQNNRKKSGKVVCSLFVVIFKFRELLVLRTMRCECIINSVKKICCRWFRIWKHTNIFSCSSHSIFKYNFLENCITVNVHRESLLCETHNFKSLLSSPSVCLHNTRWKTSFHSRDKNQINSFYHSIEWNGFHAFLPLASSCLACVYIYLPYSVCQFHPPSNKQLNCVRTKTTTKKPRENGREMRSAHLEINFTSKHQIYLCRIVSLQFSSFFPQYIFMYVNGKCVHIRWDQYSGIVPWK